MGLSATWAWAPTRCRHRGMAADGGASLGGAVVVATVNLEILQHVVAVGILLGEDPLDLVSGCCAETEMCPFLVRVPNSLLQGLLHPLARDEDKETLSGVSLGGTDGHTERLEVAHCLGWRRLGCCVVLRVRLP